MKTHKYRHRTTSVCVHMATKAVAWGHMGAHLHRAQEVMEHPLIGAPVSHALMGEPAARMHIHTHVFVYQGTQARTVSWM